MRKKYFIFLFLLSFLSTPSFGDGLFLSSVSFPKNKKTDSFTRKQLSSLRGRYPSIKSLKKKIRTSLVGLGLRKIKYEIMKKKDKEYSLSFSFESFPRVSEVFIRGELPPSFQEKLFILSKGDYLSPSRVQDSVLALESILKEQGFPNVQVKSQTISQKKGIHLIYDVKIGRPQTLKEIKVVGGDHFLREIYEKKLKSFLFTPLDRKKLKEAKEELDFLVQKWGYYSLRTYLREDREKKDSLLIHIEYEGPYIFSFYGQEYFSLYELKNHFRVKMKGVSKDLVKELLKKELKDKYEEAGFYGTKVLVQKQVYKRQENGQRAIRYNIRIHEGNRFYIGREVFLGNEKVKSSELSKFYRKQASPLIKGGYFDSSFFAEFPKSLGQFYAEKGFLLSKSRVRAPYISSENIPSSQPEISIFIQEGGETIIKTLKVYNQYQEEIPHIEILNELSNAVGKPFNPYKVSEDISKLIDYFRGKGFLKAQVLNKNHSSVTSYSKDTRTVHLNYIMSLGGRYLLNNVQVLGNEKTKSKLIRKRVVTERGEVLTESVILDLKKRLFSMGLFSSVDIYPEAFFLKNYFEGEDLITDLIIRVKEKDYGRVELTPGIRSDSGVKLGFYLGYANLGGMGRSLQLSSALTHRLNYSVLDPKRVKDKSQWFEYDFKLSYREFDIFKTDIHYLAEVGGLFRRYYAFGANIFWLSNMFNYYPQKNWEFSFGHRLEKVRQENAYLSENNGRFQIGSLLPSLSYDWRNRVSNPTSGGFHQLQLEWAHPLFLSQNDQGLRIEFVKYILRNRFYIPFDGGTLALSWALGLEENQSEQGYIPGVKLFRLTGADIVRGFSDEEINKMPDGKDISQSQVKKRLFLNSLKVEPRFYMNKNLMIGLFWDAGRVTKDQDRFFNLRQSVGVSLKLLTPVGSINLDYGHKLDRETDINGQRESAGRFHLSIGLF